MSQEKTDLVVKSNHLIGAGYRLSLVEQQIILFALTRAREEQKGLSKGDLVTISVTDFARVFGSSETGIYTQLKKALNVLYERSVVIHDTDPATGKPRVVSTRWISDKAYVDGCGAIQLTFSPKVLPYITRLESEFTSYRLEKISGMTSAHAIRIYEMLAQYLDVRTRQMSIDELRSALQITTEYKLLADFKKRVIDVAVEQINAHSDIRVSYEQRKSGRTVTHLDFSIKPAKATKAAPAAPSPVTPEASGSAAYAAKIAKELGMSVPELASKAGAGETWDQLARRLKAEAA
jgi:plasmid replication initiation protein